MPMSLSPKKSPRRNLDSDQADGNDSDVPLAVYKATETEGEKTEEKKPRSGNNLFKKKRVK